MTALTITLSIALFFYACQHLGEALDKESEDLTKSMRDNDPNGKYL